MSSGYFRLGSLNELKENISIVMKEFNLLFSERNQMDSYHFTKVYLELISKITRLFYYFSSTYIIILDVINLFVRYQYKNLDDTMISQLQNIFDKYDVKCVDFERNFDQIIIYYQSIGSKIFEQVPTQDLDSIKTFTFFMCDAKSYYIPILKECRDVMTRVIYNLINETTFYIKEKKYSDVCIRFLSERKNHLIKPISQLISYYEKFDSSF